VLPLFLAIAQAAMPTRVAVVVSANEGLASEAPLRFADVDGDRVAQVLTELADLEPGNLFRASSATVDGLTSALTRAVVRASAIEQAGSEVLLFVYYTGHAGADGLHLSGETLSLVSLKTAARVVPARERVFVVDACQSGQLHRSKGATLVELNDRPADFEPPPDEAWIASSGPEENAFEVDQRRGALFTHFFVSGARGAADANHDGDVQLGELYAYVQRQTEVAAAGLGVVQTPQWAGALETLVLSRPGSSGTGIEATGPLPEPMLVVDVRKGRVAAEVPAGSGSRVALPPGPYQLVTVSHDRRPQVAHVQVHAGQLSEVSASSLRPTRGLRTKGGLVDPRPWSVSAGYVSLLGATPGRAAGHGGFVGARQSLGRGHRVEVGAEVGRVSLGPPGWSGANTWGGGRAQWGYDFGSYGVRGGPALELDLGGLAQQSQRAPDPTWGPWYGDAHAPRQALAAYGRGLLGGAAEVPVGPLALVGFVGAGRVVLAGNPQAGGWTAQLRVGVAVGR
jgi:hypothetical protein